DSGHEVTVCARTPVDCLVLERGGAVSTVDVAIATDPSFSGLGKADIVWVTVKATDTAGVAPWLERLCRSGSLVASSQNGLDQASPLAPFAPAGTEIVPALAYIAAERLAPGRVLYLAGNRVITSEDGRSRLDEAVGAGGLVIWAASDMVTASW